MFHFQKTICVDAMGFSLKKTCYKPILSMFESLSCGWKTGSSAPGSSIHRETMGYAVC